LITDRPTSSALLLLLAALLASGCRQDMHDQPKYLPDAASRFFADGRADRPQVPGTVPYGSFRAEPALLEGKVDGKPVAELPVPLSMALLERGRERYDIYCSPCHDRVGDGNGMIVQRGFRRPPSFHIPRLREAPAGHFFDVVTNGFGVMLSYRAQIEVEDRWAIVAYVRALQLAQNATVADVPQGERATLEAGAGG
jgi:hypothetical protein